MIDFSAKQFLLALLVASLALLYVLVMVIYLLPIIPLVVFAAKGQKFIRMKIIEKDLSL